MSVDRLRLASYNIHIGVGRDGHFHPERVAAVLRELQADVIALQEVQLGAGTFDMLAHLAAATGYASLPGPTLMHPAHGHYGNALLCRHPIVAHRRLDLSVPGHEPRGALDATVECGEGVTLRVMATHLGLRPTERRDQVQRLLREVNADTHRGPTVLLGDLNEWFLWGRPLRWLHAHFGRPPSPPTFPAGRPVAALDRIWVKPRACLRGISVHRSALSRQASDHLPVVATIDLVRCRVQGTGVREQATEARGQETEQSAVGTALRASVTRALLPVT